MLSFRQKPEYYHWLNIIFVICLALLAYGTTLGHSFVWDDFYLIVDNDFVKSWDNIHLLFKNDYLTPLNKLDYTGEMFIGSGELSYRPVSTLSHFVEYHFWKLNPFGYHLTNMILHTINAILVYAFVCLLRQPKRISLLTSVLFAIHPVNSEVVNVISFREDLLVVFFGLLALIAYLFLCENRKYNFWIYCSSMVFYFLALFSKEMAITIPFLMLLSRYYVKQEKLSKESFWPHIKKYGGGYIILTLFYLWVWAFPMARNTDLMINYFDGNVLVRIMTMTKVIGVYLVWLCFPVDIHATISDYSFVVRSISDPYFLTAAFSIICLTLFVYQWRQLMAFLCFATLWFWITLLPVLNIK
ncbi:MAG: hypothetical protein KC684_00195, partial [Candidatus Omnitrophica bacterium]|nr:hypothetical protein [Candidatus Omnitrophota bacterium]